jgi:hypothetical protein
MAENGEDSEEGGSEEKHRPREKSGVREATTTVTAPAAAAAAAAVTFALLPASSDGGQRTVLPSPQQAKSPATTTTNAASRNDDDVEEVAAPATEAVAAREQGDEREEAPPPPAAAAAAPAVPGIKLYKSTRLKGYITLTLASFINYDAAQNSGNVHANNVRVVPSELDQRRYAVAASVVSLVLVAFCLVAHLDRVTPLEQRVWINLFRPKSHVEGALAAFLLVWWTSATGVSTAVSGLAGDGKGQYSLYYSSWVCTITSYWIFERWAVAAGWSSLKAFISSWPNRSPAWICIMVLSFVTLVRTQK